MTPGKHKRLRKIHDQILNEPDLTKPVPELGKDAKARMEALWDLTLEYYAKAGFEGAVGRLDKSACRVIRLETYRNPSKPGNKKP